MGFFRLDVPLVCKLIHNNMPKQLKTVCNLRGKIVANILILKALKFTLNTDQIDQDYF